MERIPVYQIADFRFEQRYFYANKLRNHVKKHEFIEAPHRHNFYFALLCTKGTGTHEIDFKTYPVSKGSVFLMSPGQIHKLKLSDDADGFVFFHTGEFYDSWFTHKQVDDYPFFSQIEHSPMLQLDITQLKSITDLFERTLREYNAEDTGLKNRLLIALTDLVYLEVSRISLSIEPNAIAHSPAYVDKLRQLQKLINRHYKTTKSPTGYAGKMNMTAKHLNRICNETIGKTTTDLIAERVVLEAKRLLTHSGKSIKEIADDLGFDDTSYFIRFFKKQSGQTPTAFVNGQYAKHS